MRGRVNHGSVLNGLERYCCLKEKTMKVRLCLASGLLCFLMCTQVGAFGFMGPPTAQLDQAQWSAGYDYSYSTQDLDETRQNWYLITGGVVTDSGKGRMRIEDLTVQRHYAGINYGLNDRWEVFLRGGVAETEADIHWLIVDEQSAYDFDADVAFGWGTRVTLAKQDTIDWGAMVQMNWLDISASKRGTDPTNGPWKDDVDIDSYDLLVAGGPVIDMTGWKVYAGPFYYYLSGDYSFRRTYTTVDLIDREKADLEAGSDFGGFVGAKFDLCEKSSVTVEFSATGDGWSAGVGAAITF
jgi:hypothetical protein